MKDPTNPSRYVLKTNAKKLFVKEMKYVQRGWLSDVPGVVKYIQLEGPWRLPRFRAICGSTSALEGYHLHARLAQAMAGHGGSSLKIVRLLLFNWVWNLQRLHAARMIPHIGHMHLNYIDEICFVLHRLFPSGDLPHNFTGYVPVDTTRPPLAFSGRTGFDPYLFAESMRRNSAS
jgi:hypothetical protein